MKKTEIVYVTSLKDGLDSMEFIRRVMCTPELHKDFGLSRGDATAIGDVLREWVVQHGISSLFYHHITCDAVLHPGFTTDKIEELILGFVGALRGLKNLFIIDPYFYSSEPAVLALFENMVRELSATLESVTFFTRPRRNDKERQDFDPTAMHSVMRAVIPTIRIKEVLTDTFHDRFWIDPDNNNGLVMGTSLNGVTKKIALIDRLNRVDATQLATMARALDDCRTNNI